MAERMRTRAGSGRGEGLQRLPVSSRSVLLSWQCRSNNRCHRYQTPSTRHHTQADSVAFVLLLALTIATPKEIPFLEKTEGSFEEEKVLPLEDWNELLLVIL